MTNEEYMAAYAHGVEDTIVHYRAMFKTQYTMVYYDYEARQWKWQGNWASKEHVRCLVEGSEEMIENLRTLL